MRITGMQLRKVIREEISRSMRLIETRAHLDPDISVKSVDVSSLEEEEDEWGDTILHVTVTTKGTYRSPRGGRGSFVIQRRWPMWAGESVGVFNTWTKNAELLSITGASKEWEKKISVDPMILQAEADAIVEAGKEGEVGVGSRYVIDSEYDEDEYNDEDEYVNESESTH